MIEALYIAATGMHAEASQIDTISNNMANLNTTAYKRQGVSFESLMYQAQENGATGSRNQSYGMGAVADKIVRFFEPGDIKSSENWLDVAISGKGFFEVELPNGALAYTRAGNFKLDENGFLSTREGHLLADRIQMPADSSQLRITDGGDVYATFPDSSEELIGSISLAGFMAEQDLDAISGGLYIANESSGSAFYSEPGDGGLGLVRQGYVETSNVDLVEEMLSLTMAQRAYEGNSQVIRAADEMMRINNSLRI
ncbi:flagellar hook-basal body protein [Microbulbifer rhizosphaerae]|uniref:Flagellar basal-body rod protein FlgG n=1 Tax=Microbulbifer rhizosphaerae TaxID=1562603 RepID=A0A7W4WFX0_9GAMM|nr:flagellar hook-basal body complex protein [Microbulbifer rhizosphaerae]MBB3063484.1 flagellar basal-body rod protein FlgG [Microbulbifer rhizosphaerae]